MCETNNAYFRHNSFANSPLSFCYFIAQAFAKFMEHFLTLEVARFCRDEEKRIFKILHIIHKMLQLKNSGLILQTILHFLKSFFQVSTEQYPFVKISVSGTCEVFFSANGSSVQMWFYAGYFLFSCFKETVKSVDSEIHLLLTQFSRICFSESSKRFQ